MQALIVKSRTPVVSVRCDASSSKPNKFFPLLNGPGAKKRNASIKENLNKLIAIGTAEFREAYEFALELDEAHKKAFNLNKAQEGDLNIKDSDKEDDENIFIDKDEQ
jgi:hypothetical protein